jgi:hypothetical protein
MLWFRSVILAIPVGMIDKFLLLTWRVWHARNEGTHDKPLSTVEGSVSFLCGYLKLLQNNKTTPTYQILHGKQPLIDASVVPAASQAKYRLINPGAGRWLAGSHSLLMDPSRK